MLTPQEVSNRAFAKAMMGGYNMAMVDEFLDELTDDYTSLYKENAALKSKMKVLVDKVEEYRATEDAMRAALMTAQKMANNIVKEAEEKRDALLAEAETRARERIGDLEGEMGVAQKRLSEGQKSLAEFIRTSREACEKQLAFLDSLPDLPVEAPVKAESAPVAQEIEEKILSSYDQPQEEAQTEAQAPEEIAEEEKNPFLDDATRVLNLEDLKFGRNYNGGK